MAAEKSGTFTHLPGKMKRRITGCIKVAPGAPRVLNPDTYELGRQDFAQLRSRGRPLGSGSKVQVTLRLDIDVVEKLKEGGTGWQTRVNAMLRKSVMRPGKTMQGAKA